MNALASYREDLDAEDEVSDAEERGGENFLGRDPMTF
jgi:hypothetical protein